MDEMGVEISVSPSSKSTANNNTVDSFPTYMTSFTISIVTGISMSINREEDITKITFQQKQKHWFTGKKPMEEDFRCTARRLVEN